MPLKQEKKICVNTAWKDRAKERRTNRVVEEGERGEKTISKFMTVDDVL